MFGVERLANYLQKLGQENAREIYELSILVLAENVELGVKVNMDMVIVVKILMINFLNATQTNFTKYQFYVFYHIKFVGVL